MDSTPANSVNAKALRPVNTTQSRIASSFHVATQVAVLVGLLILSACGKPGEAQVLAAASKQIEADDSHTAIIELRRLLQDSPQSGSARSMLGRALLATGNAADAEAELRRALESDGDRGQVLPLLARSLLLQRKSSELFALDDGSAIDNPTAAAEFDTTLAQGHQSAGQLDQAKKHIQRALQRQPGHIGAQVMDVRLTAEGGGIPAAKARAAELAARYPQDAQVLLLLADALASSGDPGAPAAYARALALDPKLEPAHSALIADALRQRDFAKARALVQSMNKAMPGLSMPVYQDALVSFFSGDFSHARESVQQLLRAKEPQPVVLMLAGYIEGRLGAFTQADALLARALIGMPEHADLRREAAAISLQLGQPGLALQRLKPLLNPDSKDAAAWIAAGRAYTLLADFKAADDAFARARALRPQDAQTRRELARSQLARGNVESSLRELESLAEGPKEVAAQALLDLVPAFIQRQDLARALAATDKLVSLLPSQPQPELLRGQIMSMRGDSTGARAAFEASLKKEPGFVLAVQRLAEIDLAEGKSAAARQRFEAVLKRQPKSVPALLAMAEITRLEGAAPDRVQVWLDKAVEAEPQDPQAWVGALQVDRRTGLLPAWLARAQRAAAALPLDADIQNELGRALRANGDTQQALRVFRQAADLRPQSALPRLLLADALAANRDIAGARKAVNQALAVDPHAFEVERAHALLLTRENQIGAAVQVAEARRKRLPRDLDTLLLEAELRSLNGQPERTLLVLREALALSKASFVASRLSAALRRSGTPTAAQDFEQAWMRDNPKDAAFISNQAQQAAQRGDTAQAQALYRRVLELQPDAALSINNLAQLLLKSQPAESLALAQRAAKLMPSSPALLDTLAQAQAAAGQMGAALQNQSRAVELDPHASELRLTLARLQIRAGEKDKARQELERLAARGDATYQVEVTQMLSDLQR